MIRTIALRRLTASLVVMLPFVALVCDPSPGLASPLLGPAGDFAVLAGTAVTNTGSTTIGGAGNVGVSPGTSIDSGFTFGTGTTHSNDGLAQAARIAAFTGVAPISAFTFLEGLTPFINLTGHDLGTSGTLPISTLLPGFYHFDSSAQLNGQLTLDNQGNNNAVFVFQIGSTLTTASASSILLTGGGTDDGVFWVVGSSATLDTTTSFIGNILADIAITLNTGATIDCGSALAKESFVALHFNTINVGCAGGFRSVGDTFELIGPEDSGGVSDDSGGSPEDSGGSAATPEPSAFLLLAAGLIGVAARMRRAKSR